MKTTLGVFRTHEMAEKALNELRAFGVAESDLSYVYIDLEGDIVDKQTGEKVGSGTVTGAATLFVAGPLAAAMGLTGAAATTVAGAATGVVAGGMLGALATLGVSPTDAELYEALVHKGDVLVVARTPLLDAQNVFVKSGATEVREYM